MLVYFLAFMGGEKGVRRKQCNMRLWGGGGTRHGPGRCTKDLGLYSECNEKMTRDFSRVKRRSYMCFRKITMTAVWRPHWGQEQPSRKLCLFLTLYLMSFYSSGIFFCLPRSYKLYPSFKHLEVPSYSKPSWLSSPPKFYSIHGSTLY